MENKKYLNEEIFQKNKIKLTKTATTILLIGFLIGISLITIGLIKQSKINSKYSEENKINLSEQIENEKQKLETKRLELESNGITYNNFTQYTDGQAYDLKILTEVLNPSYDRCDLYEYTNNKLTSKYCSLKKELDEITHEFNKSFDSHSNIPFYMFGGFIIISSCMISFVISRAAKGREIAAFYTQQTMPIAKEKMEEMAPYIGNVAKEITKGIKKGIKDEEE